MENLATCDVPSENKQAEVKITFSLSRCCSISLLGKCFHSKAETLEGPQGRVLRLLLFKHELFTL